MSSPGPASPLVLTVRGVSKAFGAVQALRDVSVDCRAGEIHALVGENGSGKSTLLGIASGFLVPDEGAVEIGGRRRRRGSPAEARRSGLGIAYQTYSHVLDLSVAENLYLAVPRDVQPDYGHMEEWAAARLEEFKLDVPVTAAVGRCRSCNGSSSRSSRRCSPGRRCYSSTSRRRRSAQRRSSSSTCSCSNEA